MHLISFLYDYLQASSSDVIPATTSPDTATHAQTANILNTTATGMPKNTNPAVVKPIPAMPIIDTVNGLEYNFLITKQVFLKNFQIFL